MQNSLNNLLIVILYLTLFAHNRTYAGTQSHRNKHPRGEHQKPKDKSANQSLQAYSHDNSRSNLRAHDRDLASKKVVRGMLGAFMNGLQTFILGGDVSYPVKRDLAAEGGATYWTLGSEYFSITSIEVSGGAAYLVPISSKTVARFGGRIGVQQISVSFKGLLSDDSGTATSSSSGIFLEGRAGIETDLGGATIGAMFQLPILTKAQTSGTLFAGAALYGTIGYAFY